MTALIRPASQPRRVLHHIDLQSIIATNNYGQKYNVMLLGSGGRECALAWELAQSPLLKRLFIAPGNGGTDAYGTNVDISPMDFDAVSNFVASHAIDIVVCGNEDPLVGGIREALIQRFPSLLVVGPDAVGAALEGSKDYAKAFMAEYGIPTAAYRTFDAASIAEGEEFLGSLQPPYVLKADGLAAGKGVLIIDNLDEARKALRQMLSGMFGQASARVVIEEFLSGIECSVFVLTDGTGNYRILPVAKDYKRIGEGDTGPNTGGMGAVSPVAFADEAFMSKVRTRIIEPTLAGLRNRDIDYRGIIFLGLINVGSDPYVIEYNVRMGDPETEAVMLRIDSDLLEIFAAAAGGALGDIPLNISPLAAATVMAVAPGYPGSYPKGLEMTIDTDRIPAEAVLFHAGTRCNPDGTLVTAGGRVIAASATAPTLIQALDTAYKAIDAINFEGKYRRSDIGRDVLSFNK